MQCVLLALIREPDHDMCRAFVHMCVSTLTTYSEPGAYRSSNKASTFNLHWTSTRGSGFSYTEGHLGQTSPFSLAMLEDGQVIDRIRALLQPELQNFGITCAIYPQLRHSMPFVHHVYCPNRMVCCVMPPGYFLVHFDSRGIGSRLFWHLERHNSWYRSVSSHLTTLTASHESPAPLAARLAL